MPSICINCDWLNEIRRTEECVANENANKLNTN